MRPSFAAILFVFSSGLSVIPWANAQSSNENKSDSERATILYTGQLFGYMRGTDSPSEQQCSPSVAAKVDLREVGWKKDGKLLGAAQLPCAIEARKTGGAVLIGMGNNFSPAYFARFASNGQRISHVTAPKTIAEDSVALFLYRAGYDAVVPGKDDFYFGAYHLMQVGRLLNRDGHPVMLASNLFLRQEQIAEKPKEPKPARVSKLGYVSQRVGINPQFSVDATPWLVSLKFDFDPQKVIMPGEGRLCPASKTDPEALPIDPKTSAIDPKQCIPWTMWRKEEGEQEDKWVKGPIPQDQARHTSKQTFHFIRNLQSGNPQDDFILPGNYGFCLFGAISAAPAGTRARKRSSDDEQQSKWPYCQTLQILEPMFCSGSLEGCELSPKEHPSGTLGKKYPPYVLVDRSTEGQVAIFGVVDENLRSYIARENASWEPKDPSKCAFGTPCRTGIHVISPDAALQQVLEHFSIAHRDFRGIKILMAQMTEAFAGELAAHVEDPTTDPGSAIRVSLDISAKDKHAPAFDAVFARATEADATPNMFLQIRNARKRRASVFVPRPIYDTKTKATINSLSVLRIQRENEEGIVSYCNSLVDHPDETECQGLQVSEKDQKEKASQREVQKLMPYITTKISGVSQQLETQDKTKQICKDATDKVRDAVCEILRRYDQRLNNNTTAIYDSDWFETTFQQFTLDSLLDYSEVSRLSSVSLSPKKASHHVSGADVALLQRRDFWYGTVENTDISLLDDTQQLLDRILWKDDLLTETNLSGAQIKNLLTQSDKFEKEEKDASLILPDSPERGIIKAGLVISKKKSLGEEDRYYNRADDFENTDVYRVVTSNHLASGETGYPDAGKPTTGKQQVFYHKQAVPISVVICRAMLRWADTDEQSLFKCRSHIDEDRYQIQGADQMVNAATRPAKSDWSHIGSFVRNTFWPPPNPYRDTQGEKWLQGYPINDVNLNKVSIAYNLSSPDTSIQNLRNFSGITNSDFSQPTSSKLDLDQGLRILHRFRWRLDLGIEDRLEYTRQEQDSLTSPTSTSWPRNNFIIGPVLQFRGLKLRGNKYRPHFLYVVRPFDSAIQVAKTSFTLSGANSTSAVVEQRKAYSFTPKFGFRLERDGDSYFETGLQRQHNHNVLSALLLNPGSGLAPCLLSAAQSLATCAQGVTLDPNAPPETQYSNFIQQGMYWDAKLKIPLATKLSYQFDTHGDLFANRPLQSENSALARYDVILGHSLKVPLIGNFSFEPRFEWVFYENKILGNNLTRRNFSLKLSYNFKRDSRVPLWRMMNYDSSSATSKGDEK